MNKNQSNTDKILKLIDKFNVDDIPELNNVLKNHMTEKIMSKAKEHGEFQEKLISLSNSINNTK